jgi:hypothetical protein
MLRKVTIFRYGAAYFRWRDCFPAASYSPVRCVRQRVVSQRVFLATEQLLRQPMNDGLEPQAKARIPNLVTFHVAVRCLRARRMRLPELSDS